MILVTGAAGLVGNPLAQRLIADGHSVVATDARPPDRPLDCSFFEADLRDPSAIARMIDRNDIRQVVHAGAISGSLVAPNDPLRVMSVNVTGTILVAESCRLAGVDRIVALSSIGVYGNQPGTGPVREDAHRLGKDPYSCSKIAMESVLTGYRENFGLPVVMLRMSSIFGPGRRTPCFIRGLLDAALDGRAVTVSADTDHRRQFLYIDDAVDAVCLTLSAPRIPNFIYNITGGTWLTEGEVIDIAKQAVPTLRAEIGDVPPLGLDGRMGPLDTTLAARDLAYSPATTLENGVLKYFGFLRQVADRPLVTT